MTDKPQLDERLTQSRASGRNQQGRAMEQRRLSSPMASQPRFNGSRDATGYLETKKQTVRRAWPEMQAETQ